jgi:hypothetical protein
MKSFSTLTEDGCLLELAVGDVEAAIRYADDIIDTFKNEFPHKDYSEHIIKIAEMVLAREACYAKFEDRSDEE